VDEACDRLIRTQVAAAPNPAAVTVMNDAYQQYRRLYPLLRTMHEPQRSPVVA
jgi:hypothetical protein